MDEAAEMLWLEAARLNGTGIYCIRAFDLQQLYVSITM